MLVIGIFFIAAIRLAAKEEEIFVTAANAYISDFEANKKILHEIYISVKKQSGLLPLEKKQEAILFFAYLKVPSSEMLMLIEGLNFLYTMTKLDTELLSTLLHNIHCLSKTSNDLELSITTLKAYILKGKSTPYNLVKILNDTLHIAIENDIDFCSFTDTILADLSRGYAQTSITEQISRKYAKKPQ